VEWRNKLKIIETRESLETCTEAGWNAIDCLLDEPMDDSFVESLRAIDGSFLYMKMLRKPFFKVENHNYILKGVKENSFFRLAFHRDSFSEAKKIIAILNGEQL
jgi:hypothetical protein